jgi:hypothetical protein
MDGRAVLSKEPAQQTEKAGSAALLSDTGISPYGFSLYL